MVFIIQITIENECALNKGIFLLLNTIKSMQSLTDMKDQEMRLADEMMRGASCVSCGIWHDCGYVRNRVFFGVDESGWSCDMCIMELSKKCLRYPSPAPRQLK